MSSALLSSMALRRNMYAAQTTCREGTAGTLYSATTLNCSRQCIS